MNIRLWEVVKDEDDEDKDYVRIADTDWLFLSHEEMVKEHNDLVKWIVDQMEKPKRGRQPR